MERRKGIVRTASKMDRSELARLLDQKVRGYRAAAAVRRGEIKSADTARFLRTTAGLLSRHLAKLPPRRSSGLVEQQYWFGKIRP